MEKTMSALDTTQSETLLTEVLDDGTIYSLDIAVCDQAADDALEALWEKEDSVLNFDFTASVFQMFIKSIHILTSSGWSTEDLVDAVYDHSEADDAFCEDCGERLSDHDIDFNPEDEDEDE
jgi:hypothetical protein